MTDPAMNKLLLTSFTTWLPHQTSNSSDDLLQVISQLYPENTYLRQLPVDIDLASKSAIAKIQELQPDTIICCGMAERRNLLSIEAQAMNGDDILHTLVDLPQLIAGIDDIEISYDAGKFVCEGLYYSVLKYLQDYQMPSRCIFVHVPVINFDNSAAITTNFLSILHRLINL